MKPFWILLGVGLFLAWLSVTGQANFLSSSVEKITLPIRSRLFSLGESKTPTGSPDEKLSAEKLLIENGKLLEENRMLRDQLGVIQTADWGKLVAGVVGRGQGILRLSVGSVAGVKKGQAVFVGPAIVGEIQEANEWGSSVSLPTSSRFAMVAEVRGQVSGGRRADGLVVGRGGRVRLTKVLKDDQISEGDVVVTLGGEGEPAGLIIGKILKVESPKGIYQEAEIEPAVRFSDLRTLFVAI